MNEQSEDTPRLKTSALLNETLLSLEGTHVEVGHLMTQFQRRSYGGVLLILA